MGLQALGRRYYSRVQDSHQGLCCHCTHQGCQQRQGFGGEVSSRRRGRSGHVCRWRIFVKHALLDLIWIDEGKREMKQPTRIPRRVIRMGWNWLGRTVLRDIARDRRNQFCIIATSNNGSTHNLLTLFLVQVWCVCIDYEQERLSFGFHHRSSSAGHTITSKVT